MRVDCDVGFSAEMPTRPGGPALLHADFPKELRCCHGSTSRQWARWASAQQWIARATQVLANSWGEQRLSQRIEAIEVTSIRFDSSRLERTAPY
jgi:hypothetical protein